MLKPEEVNESNANQAIDEMVSEIRKLITEARRVWSVTTALANSTHSPDTQATADQAERVVQELDTMLSDLLEGYNN